MPLDEHKSKALDLANQHAAPPDAVVARAAAYHAFLTGGAAPATKPAATATTKPATGTATTKPAATKPAATKPAATKPAAAPAAGSTKAPGGTHTQDDVRDIVRKVATTPGLGKDRAIEILKEDGGGVESFKDLKPESFDAVYEACQSALSGGEGGEAVADAEDPLGME